MEWGTSRSEVDSSQPIMKNVVQVGSQEVPEGSFESTPLLQVAAHKNGSTIQNEVKVVAQYSAPLILANLLQFSINVTSMIVVGGKGKVDLGAVSIASMTANITGIVVIQGLCTGLDTLCPQAWGAGSKKLVGLYVQRMVLLLGCASIPIACLWLFATHLLGYILPTPETARLAGLYLRILILGLPGLATFEAGKRILTSQGKFLPVVCILLVGASLNVLTSWLFVWVSTIYHFCITLLIMYVEIFDWGFVGAPIAVVLTMTILPLGLIIYIVRGRGFECWAGLDMAIFRNWAPMIRLAIPGLIMYEAECIAFEILVLAAAYMSTSHLAAQTILGTVNGVFWQVPFSISVAASTRVAQNIGARAPHLAKISAIVALGGVFASITVNSTVFLVARYHLPRIFTNDREVIALVAQTLPLVAAMHLLDALSAYCNGVLRGIGRQSIGSWVNLGCYYIVAIPFCLWSAFQLHWDLYGLWAGLTLALVIVVMVEGLFLVKANWQRSVDDAERRNNPF